MKRDVGMACKKETNKKGYKNEGKYTKPVPTSFHNSVTGLCIFSFTFTYILSCWCTFWHAIPTSLFIFNDFSVMFLYIFW